MYEWAVTSRACDIFHCNPSLKEWNLVLGKAVFAGGCGWLLCEKWLTLPLHIVKTAMGSILTPPMTPLAYSSFYATLCHCEPIQHHIIWLWYPFSTWEGRVWSGTVFGPVAYWDSRLWPPAEIWQIQPWSWGRRRRKQDDDLVTDSLLGENCETDLLCEQRMN